MFLSLQYSVIGPGIRPVRTDTKVNPKCGVPPAFIATPIKSAASPASAPGIGPNSMPASINGKWPKENLIVGVIKIPKNLEKMIDNAVSIAAFTSDSTLIFLFIFSPFYQRSAVAIKNRKFRLETTTHFPALIALYLL